MIKNKTQFLLTIKKAALIGVAFFLLLPIAQASKKNRIIKSSQEFFSKGQRKASIEVIVKALKNQVFNKADSKALLEALSRSSLMFYTEKAMKKHSLAKSVLASDTQLAKLILKEALLLEPNNLSIEQLMIKQHLISRECRKAKMVSSEVLSTNPFAKKVLLYAQYANICLENFSEINRLLKVKRSSFARSDRNHLRALMALKAQSKKDAKQYIQRFGGSKDLILTEALAWLSQEKELKKAQRARFLLKSCESEKDVKNKILNVYVCEYVGSIEADLKGVIKKESLDETTKLK